MDILLALVCGLARLPQSDPVPTYTVQRTAVITEVRDSNGSVAASGTDETALVQWALDRLTPGRTAPERVALIGTFRIRNTNAAAPPYVGLRVPSRCILDVRSAVIENHMGGTAGRTAGFVCNASMGSAFARDQDIEIRGGTFDGRYDDEQGFGLSMEGIDGLVLRDCVFRGARADQIRIGAMRADQGGSGTEDRNRATAVRLVNVVSDDAGVDGLVLDNVRDAQVTAYRSRNFGRRTDISGHAVSLLACTDITVTDAVGSDSTGGNLDPAEPSKASAFRVFGNTSAGNSRNVAFMDCVAERCHGRGWDAWDADGLSFTNCAARDCSRTGFYFFRCINLSGDFRAQRCGSEGEPGNTHGVHFNRGRKGVLKIASVENVGDGVRIDSDATYASYSFELTLEVSSHDNGGNGITVRGGWDFTLHPIQASGNLGRGLFITDESGILTSYRLRAFGGSVDGNAAGAVRWVDGFADPDSYVRDLLGYDTFASPPPDGDSGASHERCGLTGLEILLALLLRWRRTPVSAPGRPTTSAAPVLPPVAFSMISVFRGTAKGGPPAAGR